MDLRLPAKGEDTHDEYDPQSAVIHNGWFFRSRIFFKMIAPVLQLSVSYFAPLVWDPDDYSIYFRMDADEDVINRLDQRSFTYWRMQ